MANRSGGYVGPQLHSPNNVFCAFLAIGNTIVCRASKTRLPRKFGTVIAYNFLDVAIHMQVALRIGPKKRCQSNELSLFP